MPDIQFFMHGPEQVLEYSEMKAVRRMLDMGMWDSSGMLYLSQNSENFCMPALGVRGESPVYGGLQSVDKIEWEGLFEFFLEFDGEWGLPRTDSVCGWDFRSEYGRFSLNKFGFYLGFLASRADGWRSARRRWGTRRLRRGFWS